MREEDDRDPTTTAPSFRSRDEVLAQLRELVEEVVGAAPDDVGLDSSLQDDLGADSLQLLDLAVACERRLHVEIPEERLPELRTVGDVLDLICGQAGAP